MYVPKSFKQVEKGVFVREITGNPQTDNIAEHYKNDALNILHSDRLHYLGLSGHLQVSKPFKNAFPYFECASIGGGSPKFEAEIIQAFNITVFDGFADSYKENDKVFREIYGINDFVSTSYNNCDLSNPFSPIINNIGCVTFVHFLEHCKDWATVKEWISKQENDIVIYGPNIEAANGDDWFHFRPSDHNVFFTIEAISELGKELGYTVESIAYSDDMLVWMRR